MELSCSRYNINMINTTFITSLSDTHITPFEHENHEILRKALGNACELLGGMTAWVARRDVDGHHPVIRLDPCFEIDQELHQALEMMAVKWPQWAVHAQLWKEHTLIYAGFPARREEGGEGYSLGMLFTGWFELTERSVGVLEGLRCCAQALFSRPLTGVSQKLPSKEPAPAVVCSCCRRTPNPQHGWIHWDDLRFIETGLASSHTVCERCASELYEDVMNGKD